MSIKAENNLKRKAQRVEIPIGIIIDGHTYRSVNWSMTGLGIEVKEGSNRFDIGKTHRAKLILQMDESSILVDVTVSVRNNRQNTVGLEMSVISDKNRRVLKHFMSLAMDGSLGNMEDLVSDISLPHIESPIKESILLGEDEHTALKKVLSKKSYLYIAGSVSLFSLFALLIIYNSIVVYNDKGVTTGNSAKIQARAAGMISNMYVTDGSVVKNGDILFSISPEKDKHSGITKDTFAEDNKKALLADKISRKRSELSFFKKEHYERLKEEDLKYKRLKPELLKAKKNLDNALALYKLKLITFSQLNKASDRVFSVEGEMAGVYSANKSQFSNAVNLKKREIGELSRELSRLNQISQEVDPREHYYSGKEISPYSGIVHSLKVYENELVNRSDLVMIIQTETKPFILMKMKAADILEITLGQEALVYSPITNRKYLAKISTVGYSYTDSITNAAMEASSSETLIRVEFYDDVQFPLNSMVDVWILDEKSLFYPLFKYLSK